MITEDEEGGTPTATATAGFGGDEQPRSGQNLTAAGLHCCPSPLENGRSTCWSIYSDALFGY